MQALQRSIEAALSSCRCCVSLPDPIANGPARYYDPDKRQAEPHRLVETPANQ